MRRWLALIFGGLALLLAGYRIAQTSSGSTATTVTAAGPRASTPPKSPTDTPPAAATHPVSSYPMVAFTLTIENPRAVWPFTAQLASITVNPNGFPGSGGEPPQDTYLMVQVNIKSEITGRMVPPPDLSGMILCHAPGEHSWSSQAEGYDEGPNTTPDRTGFHVTFGDGQPHPWDTEWVVAATTPTTHLKCELGPDPNASSEGAPIVVKVVGKRRLN